MEIWEEGKKTERVREGRERRGGGKRTDGAMMVEEKENGRKRERESERERERERGEKVREIFEERVPRGARQEVIEQTDSGGGSGILTHRDPWGQPSWRLSKQTSTPPAGCKQSARFSRPIAFIYKGEGHTHTHIRDRPIQIF